MLQTVEEDAPSTALQVPLAQLLQTEAAAREKEPARHVEQTEEPIVVEYWQAMQLLQTWLTPKQLRKSSRAVTADRSQCWGD